MRKSREDPRANQRLRTRKDLLVAAAQLLKKGRSPSMDEVAAAALVSRATAYRYFPSLDALLAEAPLEGEVPQPGALFANDPSTDPEERIDRAEAALHQMVYANLPQLRRMLATSLSGNGQRDGGMPKRQNRRTPLIEAALAPARERFDAASYRRLCRALALIFGTESMIVFADILGLGERTARDVKSWAARALVRAALQESQSRGR